MKIIEITNSLSPQNIQDRKRYDHFVANHPFGSIHQTWEWGVFQSQSANRDRFWVFALENDRHEIEASALIIRQKLPFNKCWLYCPRGPLIDYSNLGKNPQKFQPLFERIAELAREQNAVFFRFDPPVLKDQDGSDEPIKAPARLHAGANACAPAHPRASAKYSSEKFFRQLHAVPAHAHYQPENTLVLDLKRTPEELLKNMKPKCRYNIKVAQKHGVTVRESKFGNAPASAQVGTKTPFPTAAPSFQKDIEIFYKLLTQTTSRDQFSGHPQKYYENMLEIFGANTAPQAKLYLADYPAAKTPIAAIIVTYFKDTATYYFGASSNEYRNVMAPYLLQWQAITDAQKAGYKFYDFLGIAPENEPNHPWAGVTNFKLKFGGERFNYIPAQEIVYKPFWYNLIKAAKWLKAVIKR